MSIPIDPNNPPVDNGIFTVPAPNDPAWGSGERHWMLAYALVMIISTTLLLILRLVSRINRTGGKLGVDDVLIVIGWILSCSMTGIIVYGSKALGWDRHMMKVSPEIWPYGAKWTLIAEVIFMYSLLATKISVLMFYRRLISGTYSTKFKWALWFGMAFAVVTTVVPTGLLFASCKPFKAIWLQWDLVWVYANAYKFHCQPAKITLLVGQLSGAFSVISDFYSVLLPSILLLQMRLNKRQRIALFLVFGLGYVVVIAGCVRTFYLSEATSKKPDKSWNVFSVWAASIAEANVGIMCACAPSLKSIFGKFFRDLTSKNNSKESSQAKSSNYGPNTSDNMGMYFDSRVTDTGIDMEKSGRSDSVSSWVSKIPFGPKRKSEQFTGQELTSFAEAHEHGIDTYSNVVEGYDDDPNTRLDTPGSSGDETPLRPTVFRYDHAHEDLIMTSPVSPPPKYSDQRATDPAIPLPVKITGNPILLSSKEDAGQDRSNTPSFIFIDNQNGRETLRRVRYNSYMSSNDSQNESTAASKTVQRSQSLEDSTQMPRKQTVKDQSSLREQTRSVPSKPTGFEAFQFPPSPTKSKKDDEKTISTTASGIKRRGSVRQALLNLKNPEAKRVESPTQVSPRALGFPLQSSMPNFHRNNISHISDPSDAGSSASSTSDRANDEDDIEPEQATHVAKVVLAPSSQCLTPRSYPATQQPGNKPESPSVVLSPRGYPATRPIRSSSASKSPNNLTVDASRPRTSSGALPSRALSELSRKIELARSASPPFHFNETAALPPPSSSSADHDRTDSAPVPAIGVAVPWTPEDDAQLEDFPTPVSDGIQRPRVRRVKSREAKW